MKTKKLVVATLLAISVQWSTGQELTKEQINAERMREVESQLIQRAQLELIAEKEASLTSEEKEKLALKAEIRMLNVISPPLPPDPVISGVRKIRTVTSSSIGDGGIQPQALITGGGGGIQLLSLTGYGEGGVTVPPFASYGVAPFSAWQTDLIPGLYYNWFIENNSYSTNIGISSYDLIMPAFTSSRTWTILTNHFDLNGDPRAHEMRVVYKFANSGGDAFQIRYGSAAGSLLANLPSAGLNVLTTNTFIVPRILGTNLNVYFVVYRNAAISYTPFAELISVQWQTYSGPLTNALKVRKVNNQIINVSWSILNQQTNHWHLEFAGNILGPWASNTVPVTYSNWQASVNFTNNSSQRYYQLRYHWPGYH